MFTPLRMFIVKTLQAQRADLVQERSNLFLVFLQNLLFICTLYSVQSIEFF